MSLNIISLDHPSTLSLRALKEEQQCQPWSVALRGMKTAASAPEECLALHGHSGTFHAILSIFFWGGGCHLEPYLNGPVIWNDSKEKCYGTVSLATYSNVKPLKTLMEAAPFIRLSPSTPLTLGQLVVPLRLFPRWCLFSES